MNYDSCLNTNNDAAHPLLRFFAKLLLMNIITLSHLEDNFFDIFFIGSRGYFFVGKSPQKAFYAVKDNLCRQACKNKAGYLCKHDYEFLFDVPFH